MKLTDLVRMKGSAHGMQMLDVFTLSQPPGVISGNVSFIVTTVILIYRKYYFKNKTTWLQAHACLWLQYHTATAAE